MSDLLINPFRFGVLMPEFVAAGAVTYAAGAGTTITPALPAGWAAGQLAIAVVYNDDGTNNTAETGWTLETSANTAPASPRPVFVFRRVLQGGDGDPTFDWSAGPTDRHAYIATYKNVNTVTVLADYYSGTGVASATPTSQTVATDNSLLLFIGAADFYGSLRMSSANGFTERKASGTANGAGSSILVEKEVDSGSQSFPTFTWGTGANNGSFSGVVLVLS